MNLFRFSFLKKNSPSVFLETLGSRWRRWSSVLFFISFLGIVGLSVFSWYWSLYLFHWSPDEERMYRLSKNNQVSFQKEKFSAALLAIDARAEQHRKQPLLFRDIFLINK